MDSGVGHSAVQAVLRPARIQLASRGDRYSDGRLTVVLLQMPKALFLGYRSTPFGLYSGPMDKAMKPLPLRLDTPCCHSVRGLPCFRDSQERKMRTCQAPTRSCQGADWGYPLPLPPDDIGGRCSIRSAGKLRALGVRANAPPNAKTPSFSGNFAVCSPWRFCSIGQFLHGRRVNFARLRRGHGTTASGRRMRDTRCGA